MSNKKLGSVLLVVSLVLIAGFGVFKLTSDKAAAPAPEPTQIQSNGEQKPSETTDQTQTQTLTLEEVKKHSSKTDCWTIIGGKVYDVTDYVSRHLGGDEILRACGADGTSLFTSRTTSDGETVGSGTAHSSSAESQLEQFLLGDLQD